MYRDFHRRWDSSPLHKALYPDGHRGTCRDARGLEHFAFARRTWAFPGVTFFRADLVTAISTGRKGLPPWPQVVLVYADPFSNFGGLRTTAARFS